MKLFEDIFRKILLTESVSVDDVNDVIDGHKRVIINYHSKGEDNNTGARIIEVYAYGLTKAGNPVIRAFQPYGDTTTRVPSWKFFRLDRISAWKPTKQTFNRPADFYYNNIGEFNPNGDETMSVVYKIASFGNEYGEETQDITPSQPKTKDEVFKTDTERRMERLRQQMQNPIKLSDIKTGDAFKQFNDKEENSQTKNTSGPKTKQDVYKTDTERGMERLRQQLQNPKKIDLSQFDKYKPKKAEKPQKTEKEKQDDLEKLRKTLSDKPMSLSDLNKKLSSTENDKPEPYKTDTERGMERLRQQLQNPRKIDLTQFDKYKPKKQRR